MYQRTDKPEPNSFESGQPFAFFYNFNRLQRHGKQKTGVSPNSQQKAPASCERFSDDPQNPRARVPNVSEADLENCEEKIWEQLIATPPVRGRSMTTVTVEGTRILLSAWEVAAFVSDSGPNSEDLRKAIVARAMLGMAIERRKAIR